jgi:hypothetical protein
MMIAANTTTAESISPAPSRVQHTDPRWFDSCERFLASVAEEQREAVLLRLAHLNIGGSGLRDWVSAIACRGAVLPERIPEVVIAVYLRDSEAAPLFDCEGCGILIPVRPSRLLDGWDGEPDEVYFQTCPVCASRIGHHLHFSRRFEANTANPLRRRPR